MNKTFKQLFEISQIESAQGKIEELDRFLDISRSFSLKCSAHIRVLTNLVNNLVESEDWLELADTELKLPEKHRDENASLRTDDFVRKDVEGDSMFGGIRSENEKILQMIKHNENNTEYLRELLTKLLEGLKSNKNSRSEATINIRQECTHEHCCGAEVKPSAASELALSDFNLRGGDVGSDGMLRNAIDKLNAENAALKKELQQTKAKSQTEETGLREILKKLMEVKSQSEQKLREKDKNIGDLKNAMSDMGDQLNFRERETAELKKNNQILEDTLQELLQSQGVRANASGAPLIAQDAIISALKEENANLKDASRAKTNKIDEKLKDALKELEASRREVKELRKNQDQTANLRGRLAESPEKKDKVVLDFLKCCYNQAAYIEDYLLAEPPVNLNTRF